MAGLLLAGLASFLACAVSGGPSVIHFSSLKEKVKETRLESFSFKNCAPSSKELAVVNSVSVLPDPLVLPGPLTVAFNVTVKDILDTPLSAYVFMAIKVVNTWVQIPCIENFGSCTYEDVCDFLAPISYCPEPLVSSGIPCNCPFPAAQYILPSSKFDVTIPIFPPGDYHIQANFTNQAVFTGCYDIYFSFA